ncbi:MAG: phenylalanine--tRNA ligase subunit beta, partial [Solirubrobacteraceae bacterium]
FEGPELAQRLRISDRPAVRLANPMSSEQSRLRTTLLGSLLDVGRRNRARGAGALALFEAGAVYLPSSNALPDEPHHIAALLSGAVRPATWRHPDPQAADFFAAKGVLAGLLDTVRVPWSLRADPGAGPFLHPGRAARILLDGGSAAGWIGELHPGVAAEWDWAEPIAAFELDLDAVAPLQTLARYTDLTSFPELREDLAVIVADTATADEVLAVVRGAGGGLLAGAEVFDVYRDEQRIGAGNVSLALRLRFRASDRTLTDDEVAARRAKISAALAAQLEGRVRDS